MGDTLVPRVADITALGCIINDRVKHREHRRSRAIKAMYANRHLLLHKKAPLPLRLRLAMAILKPIATWAITNHAVLKSDLKRMRSLQHLIIATVANIRKSREETWTTYLCRRRMQVASLRRQHGLGAWDRSLARQEFLWLGHASRSSERPTGSVLRWRSSWEATLNRKIHGCAGHTSQRRWYRADETVSRWVALHSPIRSDHWPTVAEEREAWRGLASLYVAWRCSTHPADKRLDGDTEGQTVGVRSCSTPTSMRSTGSSTTCSSLDLSSTTSGGSSQHSGSEEEDRPAGFTLAPAGKARRNGGHDVPVRSLPDSRPELGGPPS